MDVKKKNLAEIQDSKEAVVESAEILEDLGLEDLGLEDLGLEDVSALDTLLLLISLVMQKTGLVFSISISWPHWALNAMSWMSALSIPFSLPSIDPQVTEDIFTIATALIPIALFVRLFFVATFPHWTQLAEKDPIHVHHIGRTLAKDLSIPVLLAIILISCGFALDNDWAVAFGMLVCIPGAYMFVIHTVHWLHWQTLSVTFGENKNNKKLFWDSVKIQEGWLFVFLYTATYGTAFASLLKKTQKGSLAQNIICGILAFFYGVIPPIGVYYITTYNVQEVHQGYDDYDACKNRQRQNPPVPFSLNRLMGPFEIKYCWYRALLMLEISAFTCTVILPNENDNLTKLISAMCITIFFLIISACTRPYEDDMEDITDLLGRIVVLVNLIGGIILEIFSDSSVGVIVVNVLIGGTTLVGGAWHLYVLSPFKFIIGIRQYILGSIVCREMRNWSETRIKDPSMNQRILDLREIDWKYLTSNQLELMSKYHKDAVISNIKQISASTLDFSGRGRLPAEGHAISAIAEGIRTNSSIKSINMLGNNISTQDASLLKDVLENSQTLLSICGSNKKETEADYSEYGFGPGDATLLAADLSVGYARQCWKTLSLRANDIEDDGTIAISKALKSNETLTKLDLSGRSTQIQTDILKHITSEGAKALADALEVNGVLKSLNVSGNKLDAEAITMLKNSTTICEVINDDWWGAAARRVKEREEAITA